MSEEAVLDVPDPAGMIEKRPKESSQGPVLKHQAHGHSGATPAEDQVSHHGVKTSPPDRALHNLLILKVVAIVSAFLYHSGLGRLLHSHG